MADKTAPNSKAKDDREARLKAALKANLGRRKAQAKARTDTDKADQAGKEQDDG
ncbi:MULTISPECIES: hypothetical protein [unclassified Tateyamaria]|jgi:hypothetical protein|uniref:hypothetical protein n=1 Tax=unclassified Tateyamaria TaxID=2645127 RepID=UPI001902940B|nr:hypothetical protein [Tateyamaria sp. Alg231-49]